VRRLNGDGEFRGGRSRGLGGSSTLEVEHGRLTTLERNPEGEKLAFEQQLSVRNMRGSGKIKRRTLLQIATLKAGKKTDAL